MSSADVARSFYSAVEGGDLPGGLALIAPDCTWTEMDTFGAPGVYVGPEAVRDEVFVRIANEWEDFTMTVDDVLDAGNRAVGIGTYAGRRKDTGKRFEARVVHVFRIRDGRIASFEQFADTLAVQRAKEA